MSRKYKFDNPEGMYYISFATIGWIDVFTRSIYKDIVVDSLKYCQKEKGLILYAWVIMSNHIHLIAEAKEGYLMQNIIRDIKKFTSKQILETIENTKIESRKNWMLAIFKNAGEYNSNNKYFQFWQQNNQPIELFSNKVIEQKLDYLHNNPVEAGIVDFAEDYIYSSARNYAGKEGLIEVELI